jgi:hypothetical protein
MLRESIGIFWGVFLGKSLLDNILNHFLGGMGVKPRRKRVSSYCFARFRV